ncbi:Hsp70 family protein [Pseudonocardia sp. TRM90224]|uniref:Hsp70 family protein n=1 Tax=Pseudonocardia sp. TRM90224 TaxID=2812678 RepID=UPI001E6079ED|nr:Hsp70 family protein [Pseudonocardia sp. TRM90224]
MSYVLGIDVGTTRSAAAIGRTGPHSGDIEVVTLGDRSSAVPSVIYLGDDGAVVVGEAAERRAVTDPDRVVREFKRRIGDPTPVMVAGRPWAPEELSARLVRWVVDKVAQREGGPTNRIAIAHPAAWGAHKKDLLGGALANQGLPITFIAEPQAAALHYASAERVEPGSTIAVYDFGGGTFDAAVVHKEANGSFSLLGRPEGLEHLGGIDFDEVVFQHVVEGMPEAFENLDETDPAVLSAVAAIRRECTDAKEALSSDTEVSIQVLMPGARGTVRLHRSEFEAMIRMQVEETVSSLRRAITSAGVAPEQLTAVLLVGGSSRIPLVGEMVSEQLNRPVAVDADPKNAIAKGAALSLTSYGTSRTGGHAPSPRGGRPPLGAALGAAAGAAVPPPHPGGASGSYPGSSGGYPAPPTERLSTTGGMQRRHAAPPPPPPRPPVFPERPAQDYGYAGAGDYPEYDDYDGEYDGAEYDPEPRYGRERGGSPVLLVGGGAAAAVVAVIAAVFLWPTSGASTPTGVGAPLPPTSAAATTTTEAPTTAPPTTRSPRPEPPPRTTPPPTTTTVPPTTTTPPTSTSVPPSSTTPPSSTGPTTEPDEDNR